jgi:DNA-binding NtrC family response regulator
MTSRLADLDVDSSTQATLPLGKGLLLVVDDTEEVRRLVATVLSREGYEVNTYGSGESCLSAMTSLIPDAIYLDLDMPGLSGLETLEKIRAKHPGVPIIMLTADDRIESVVAAMRLGAYDYLVKPPSRQKLLTVARNAVERYQMSVQLTSWKREAGGGEGYRGIVTGAESMKEVFRQMDRLAPTDITLLVHGESGTGKELVARAIHAHSPRRSGPFLALNCAAIPETLQESELFGHEKGAFTGAVSRRLGRFELADGGTLFLDEVAELSSPLQAKLLRVLQDNTFHRVGGADEVRSDFRLIAATNKVLSEEVRAGRFREDLYFRIVVFELELPPLRARKGDVQLLTRHFLDRFGSRGAPIELSPQASALLDTYDWPGNVRELENVVQRAVICAEPGGVEPAHLPLHIRERKASRLREPFDPPEKTAASRPGKLHRDPLEESDSPSTPRPVEEAILNLERLEERAMRTALDQTGNNLTEVCRILGVSRATLYRKLKRYGLR